MTTQETTQATETAESDQQVKEPAELRAAYEREKERRKAAEQSVLKTKVEAIGLNPDEMLGKAIVKEYDGELTKEAIAAFAQDEYGYEPPSTPAQPEPTPGQTEQARADKLQNASLPTQPAGENDAIAALDAKLAEEDATEQDAVAAMNAKLNKAMADWYGPPPQT